MFSTSGKEGMYLPARLKKHENEMKTMGLQIPVEKLYNGKGDGLNNAVVLFGRGCTGEIISASGLLLTNHHCGYGSVQRLASAGKDYFENGFWARSTADELPCPGLTVTFTRKMIDVTGRILDSMSLSLTGPARDTEIAHRIAQVEKEYEEQERLDAAIKPFFDGNEYWVSLTETYRDIRLVCFPPNGIGAFGGDDENWSWPRHTGDFSVFRVYAGPDNKPAAYSDANRPCHTSQYLKINVSGYKEGDFTMVYGFPGTTHEYISSYELRQVAEIMDPISVEARTRKLAVWSKHMAFSRDIFLKYTAKRAGVANGWKKWQGEMKGLEKFGVVAKKQEYEKSFSEWVDANSKKPGLAFTAAILPRMENASRNRDHLIRENQYIEECPLAVELIRQGEALGKFADCFRLRLSDNALRDTLKKVATGMSGFFKNYDAATDKDVFVTLMALYFSKCSDELPEYYRTQYKAHNQDLELWARDIYDSSLLTTQHKLEDFAVIATTGDSAKVRDDPAWRLYDAVSTLRRTEITVQLAEYYNSMHLLEGKYLKARMLKDAAAIRYPDANLTLRLSYGKVKGLKPDGPAPYSWQTHLKEVVALDDSTSDIFRVPARLKLLSIKKDFGRWAEKGDVPVAFIATNHTTGGNSGSPLLNRWGELTGINFDRASEGVMSDYFFTDDQCRNISVDIRYVLFIIEKFGNAGWLLKEMDLKKH